MIESTLRMVALMSIVGILAACADDVAQTDERVYESIHDGRLQSADYWSPTPEILSAGLGFDNIIGVPTLDQETVEGVGGTWRRALQCTNGLPPDDSLRTSAAATTTAATFGSDTYLDDGLPVVFSWPVRTNTITPGAFRFTLNTGEQRTPVAAGTYPNWELGERNVVVVFGDLGNRGLPDEVGAEYPVRLDIIDDGIPLTLAGPAGDVSAVGMSWRTDSTPYLSGPRLVGAKLTRVTSEGEGGSASLERQGALPNDEFALYGSQIAEGASVGQQAYRIRILTTGGFSPDGVAGVRPDEFSRYFRLQARGPAGQDTRITETDSPTAVAGGTVEVVGLSELGQVADAAAGEVYDDCYLEDHDNYIDIIVLGTDASVRSLIAVEIPAADGYSAFYNPGGPGPTPVPGTRYTAAGPPEFRSCRIGVGSFGLVLCSDPPFSAL